MLNVINIIEEGRFGGPQNRILNVSRLLEGRVNVMVVFPKFNSDTFKKLLDKSRVDYKCITLYKITKNKKELAKYFLFFFPDIVRLYFLFKKENPDLVHVSGGAWQFKGIITSYILSKKAVWHLNDTNMPRSVRFLFSVLSPLASGFIFASERTRDYYWSLLPEKSFSTVIPAPVDTDKFNPDIETNIPNDLLNKIQKKKVVGIVANINPNKGVDDFIEIASLLNKKYQDLFFVVIGHVYENREKYFHSLIERCNTLNMNNIVFITDQSDVKPYLQLFHVYACTSYYESSPTSVWEAMSMALPVVSFDVGDVHKYVINQKTGTIIIDRDNEAFSNAIGKYLDSEDLRVKVGKQARKMAIKHLDTKRVAELHESFYSELTSQIN